MTRGLKCRGWQARAAMSMSLSPQRQRLTHWPTNRSAHRTAHRAARLLLTGVSHRPAHRHTDIHPVRPPGHPPRQWDGSGPIPREEDTTDRRTTQHGVDGFSGLVWCPVLLYIGGTGGLLEYGVTAWTDQVIGSMSLSHITLVRWAAVLRYSGASHCRKYDGWTLNAGLLSRQSHPTRGSAP